MLLKLCVAAALVAAVAALDDTPEHAMESHVVDVSPKELKSLIRPADKLVFLALYFPNLPKWRLHFHPILETIAAYFKDDPRVLVAKGNCDSYPSFLKQFALQAFPAVRYYAPHLSFSIPFIVKYEANATADTYVAHIDRALAVTSDVVQGVEEVHQDVVAFINAQADLDFEIFWKTGADRRKRLAAEERAWRRKILQEDVEEPEEEVEEKYFDVDGNEVKEQSRLLFNDTLPALDLDAEAAALVPIFERVNFAIDLNRLQASKLEFYKKILEDIKAKGTGTIASQLNHLTNVLYRSDTITVSQRDSLMMKISILHKFARELMG